MNIGFKNMAVFSDTNALFSFKLHFPGRLLYLFCEIVVHVQQAFKSLHNLMTAAFHNVPSVLFELIFYIYKDLQLRLGQGSPLINISSHATTIVTLGSLFPYIMLRSIESK